MARLLLFFLATALLTVSAGAQSSPTARDVTIRSSWLHISEPGEIMIVNAMIFNVSREWVRGATVQCDFWFGSRQQQSLKRVVSGKPIAPGFGLQFPIDFGPKYFPAPYAMDCSVVDASFGGPQK